MRLLVFTCVFGGYDRVFPPVRSESAVDYVIITDDASLRVKGWRTEVVGTTQFLSAKGPNRHFKMLGHLLLTGYDVSVYVDGNIRILGSLSPMIQSFLASGAALGIFPHPTRNSVEEEIKACLGAGKVKPTDHSAEELAEYRADGFPDNVGLAETGVLLKNHSHAALDPAMTLWWSLFERFDTRDQFGLPYVIWKTGLPCHWQSQSFRIANPYFGIYPHFFATNISCKYAYLRARAFDSIWPRLLLSIWHGKWHIQRSLRRGRKAIP